MNKMFLRLVAVVAVMLMCGTASAKYLYCMIKDANYEGADVNFAYATVSVGGDYLYFYSPGDTTSTSTKMSVDPTDSNSSYWAKEYGYGFYAGDFSTEDDTYVTFLFELWAGENSKVGWQTVSLPVDHESIAGGTSTGGAKAYVISAVIPEPTSGILLLLGMAGLALRRRKA